LRATVFGSNPNIKSAKTLSGSIILYLATFLQFAWKLIAYSSMIRPTCLQLLYLRYYIFFLINKVNFVRNTYWKYLQLMIKVLISSYYLAATFTRYLLIIWNFLCSDHLFTSIILLYHSNHSLGSSISIPLNSVSFTWFNSLLTLLTFSMLNQDHMMEDHANGWHMTKNTHVKEDHIDGQHVTWNFNSKDHVDKWHVTETITAEDHGDRYHVTDTTVAQ